MEGLEKTNPLSDDNRFYGRRRSLLEKGVFMDPVEWYYARGEKRQGPVPSAELAGRRLKNHVWESSGIALAGRTNVGAYQIHGRAPTAAGLSGRITNPLLRFGPTRKSSRRATYWVDFVTWGSFAELGNGAILMIKS